MLEGAFCGAGIWPIDPLRFPEHKYAAADALNADEEDEDESQLDPDINIDTTQNFETITNVETTVEVPTSSTPCAQLQNCTCKATTAESIRSAIEKISPVPIVEKGKKKLKGGRQQQDAELLTSSPYKNLLEAAQCKREETECRKKERERLKK